MTTYYSTQMTKKTASPPQKVEANEERGRVRMSFFDYTVPAGTVLTTDTIQLCEVPAGARLLGGWLATDALSSAGGTAGVSLGDGTTAAKYLSAADCDAAAQHDFAHTLALGFGDVLTEKLILTATPTGEAWAAAADLKGAIYWVMD